MKKISYYILITLLLVLLTACGQEQQQIKASGKTIKIGVIGPMSGSEQPLGKDSLEGIRTALHMHPYLDNGDTIELIVEDDRNQPELAVKAFKKLVVTDKVAAVILLSTSGSGLAVNEIADNYQTPVLALLATHPEISKGTQFVSQICFDNVFQGKVAALFVRDELLIERVAVFKAPDSSYSSSLADEFIRMFRSIEGRITDVIPITSKAVDYDSLLSHLREQDVQLLYLPLPAEDVIEIAEKLHKIDWAPEVMTGDGLLTNVLALSQDGAHHLDGFLTIDFYSHTLEKTQYGKKATRIFQTVFETQKSTYPATGFEGMTLLMAAMNRCHQSVDRECINSQTHNTVDFEGLMGNITIQANGKARRPLIVNRIQGDRLEFVVKVY